LLSLIISNSDLGFIIGAGFVALCIVMGIIAYATVQTMKSVKKDSDNHNDFLLLWKAPFLSANKNDELPNFASSVPLALQSMTTKLDMLPTIASSSASPPFSLSQLQQPQQQQKFFLEPGPVCPPPSLSAAPPPPKQEVIHWSAPNPVTPTLRNDFADPDPAPDPFEDETRNKQVSIPRLPNSQYRIVIQNKKKTTATRRTTTTAKRNGASQAAKQAKKNSASLVETKKAEVPQTPASALEIKKEPSTIAPKKLTEEVVVTQVVAAAPATAGASPVLPAPLPLPIEPVVNESEAIPFPTNTLADDDELETPVITKRNIRNLINKNHHATAS
jgi:hypothetical protein